MCSGGDALQLLFVVDGRNMPQMAGFLLSAVRKGQDLIPSSLQLFYEKPAAKWSRKQLCPVESFDRTVCHQLR